MMMGCILIGRLRDKVGGFKGNGTEMSMPGLESELVESMNVYKRITVKVIIDMVKGFIVIL
jgi:hypothetical protein